MIIFIYTSIYISNNVCTNVYVCTYVYVSMSFFCSLYIRLTPHPPPPLRIQVNQVKVRPKRGTDAHWASTCSHQQPSHTSRPALPAKYSSAKRHGLPGRGTSVVTPPLMLSLFARLSCVALEGVGGDEEEIQKERRSIWKKMKKRIGGKEIP